MLLLDWLLTFLNTPIYHRSWSTNCTPWLPLSDRIQFKVLALVLKSKLGLAPKYLRDVIRPPLSATSHRPLRSLDRSDFFVPRARTTTAQTRSFAIIGPSLWNALPFTLRETFLSGSLSSSLSLLKTYFFSRGSHTGSATEWPRLWAALYKLLITYIINSNST